MNTHGRAVALLLLSVIFLSTSGLLIKLSSWDALALNGARSLIAAAVLWIYLRRPNFTWSLAQVGGAILYAVTIITFVQATKWTTAANAVFLQFTAPVWVALFGIWLLGERPQRIDWTTMIVIGIGMFLFFGDELTPTGYWGNLLAIFSGICMALMLIALRKQKAGSPTETILLGNLIAAAIGLPFILFGDQPVNPRELEHHPFYGRIPARPALYHRYPGRQTIVCPGNDADSNPRADPQPHLGIPIHWREAHANGPGRCRVSHHGRHHPRHRRRPPP